MHQWGEHVLLATLRKRCNCSPKTVLEEVPSSWDLGSINNELIEHRPLIRSRP